MTSATKCVIFAVATNSDISNQLRKARDFCERAELSRALVILKELDGDGASSLRARLAKLEKEKNNGVIRESDYRVEWNKILRAVINLIEVLEKKESQKGNSGNKSKAPPNTEPWIRKLNENSLKMNTASGKNVNLAAFLVFVEYSKKFKTLNADLAELKTDNWSFDDELNRTLNSFEDELNSLIELLEKSEANSLRLYSSAKRLVKDIGRSKPKILDVYFNSKSSRQQAEVKDKVVQPLRVSIARFIEEIEYVKKLISDSLPVN